MTYWQFVGESIVYGHTAWGHAAVFAEIVLAAASWAIFRWVRSRKKKSQITKFQEDLQWVAPALCALVFLIVSCFIAPYHFWEQEHIKYVDLADKERPYFKESGSEMIVHPKADTPGEYWMTGIVIKATNTGKRPAKNLKGLITIVPGSFKRSDEFTSNRSIIESYDDIEPEGPYTLRLVPPVPRTANEMKPFFILCQIQYEDAKTGRTTTQSIYRAWGRSGTNIRDSILYSISPKDREDMLNYIKHNRVGLLFPEN